MGNSQGNKVKSGTPRESGGSRTKGKGSNGNKRTAGGDSSSSRVVKRAVSSPPPRTSTASSTRTPTSSTTGGNKRAPGRSTKGPGGSQKRTAKTASSQNQFPVTTKKSKYEQTASVPKRMAGRITTPKRNASRTRTHHQNSKTNFLSSAVTKKKRHGEDSDETTEEIAQIIFTGSCLVENSLENWSIELRQYPLERKLYMHLNCNNKLFDPIDLTPLVECVVDQTKLTLLFPDKTIVLYFNLLDEIQTFVSHLPNHLIARLLFSETAMLCGRQVHALIQLLVSDSTKRVMMGGDSYGASMVIHSDKGKQVIPVREDSSCSTSTHPKFNTAQICLVSVDSQKEPHLIRFISVGMAQTFVRKFSEILHDLYKTNHILLYSGTILHENITKQLELRQYDDGRTELSVFLRKERKIVFDHLPMYSKSDLNLFLDYRGEEICLNFRTKDEIDRFTKFLTAGVE